MQNLNHRDNRIFLGIVITLLIAIFILVGLDEKGYSREEKDQYERTVADRYYVEASHLQKLYLDVLEEGAVIDNLDDSRSVLSFLHYLRDIPFITECSHRIMGDGKISQYMIILHNSKISTDDNDFKYGLGASAYVFIITALNTEENRKGFYSNLRR